jgi:hypothetical protein
MYNADMAETDDIEQTEVNTTQQATQICSAGEAVVHADPVFPFNESSREFIKDHVSDTASIKSHIFHETGVVPSNEDIILAVKIVTDEAMAVNMARTYANELNVRSVALESAHRIAQKAESDYLANGNKEAFFQWNEANKRIETLTAKAAAPQTAIQINAGKEMSDEDEALAYLLRNVDDK